MGSWVTAQQGPPFSIQGEGSACKKAAAPSPCLLSPSRGFREGHRIQAEPRRRGQGQEGEPSPPEMWWSSSRGQS